MNMLRVGRSMSYEEYKTHFSMWGMLNSPLLTVNWLRNRSTIEFIGLWEQLNNPGFNSIEFDGFKNQAGARQIMDEEKDSLIYFKSRKEKWLDKQKVGLAINGL